MFLAFIGQFFSGKFFTGDFSKIVYKRKKSKKEIYKNYMKYKDDIKKKALEGSEDDSVDMEGGSSAKHKAKSSES